MKNIKQIILDTISDLAGSFLYYDRKGDSTLSMDDLNRAVKEGIITIDEMVEVFRDCLKNTLGDL